MLQVLHLNVSKVDRDVAHVAIVFQLLACSLVGAGAGLGWLVLIFCERKTLLAGWFGLAETNK